MIFVQNVQSFHATKQKTFLITINDIIARDWEKGNRRIQEVGIQTYFNEKKDISHYISYKK